MQGKENRILNGEKSFQTEGRQQRASSLAVMAERIREQFIPAGMERDFVEEAVRINRVVMTAIAFFAIGAELFNVTRVLFLSQSGLQTQTNRIYFSFYLLLLAVSIGYLAADRLLKLKVRARYGMALAFMSVFLLWQTLFYMYDISRSISLGKIMAVTTLVAFSAVSGM